MVRIFWGPIGAIFPKRENGTYRTQKNSNHPMRTTQCEPPTSNHQIRTTNSHLFRTTQCYPCTVNSGFCGGTRSTLTLLLHLQVQQCEPQISNTYEIRINCGSQLLLLCMYSNSDAVRIPGQIRSYQSSQYTGRIGWCERGANSWFEFGGSNFVVRTGWFTSGGSNLYFFGFLIFSRVWFEFLFSICKY